jgi:hypothetical protein
MKDFSTYFTERAIVTHICKLRVKIAKTRNKKHLIHLLTDSDKYNYHNKELNVVDKNEFSEYQFELNTQLSEILPPRKRWVKLGYESRMNRYGTEKLTSNDKNYYSILKTIKVYRKKAPQTKWLLELDKFVKNIQSTIKEGDFNIKKPLIFPKLKEEFISEIDINKCRPISMFSLKERIILSISNNFLTNLFDGYFEDSSYAFRSKKNKEGTSVISHQDCIRDIVELQKINNYKDQFVVECDMEKFYDSVNHKIVKKLFNILIDKSEVDNPNFDFKIVKHIFNEYLNCYAFNINVPLAKDTKYWDSYKIPNGEFGWVKNRLIELKYYSDIEKERIGVPQGGALSGLIANIVLNEADKELLKTDVFYIRFCDDMLIIHEDKNKCEEAKAIYKKSLRELKLVPHKFVDKLTKQISPTKFTFHPFWHTKSKGAYKWGAIENNGFPWITFVGYEIHHKGNIRVRKKSLEKELKKQKKIVTEVKKAIEHGQRKVKGAVIQSAINRLIGMSVGRIGLNNYEEVSTDMCWKNGFKELSINKDSIRQIKKLDRNRSKLYYDLFKSVKELEEVNGEDEINKNTKREIIFYDKPFSYYYQILERNKNNKS